MAKLTLQDVQSGYSAPATLNANNDRIEAALENTLSRDGTGPNQMEAPLDLNGHRILNLPAPASPTDPARWVDLQEVLELDPTGLIVPSMAGNTGKVLTTDGTDATWGDVDPSALPLFDSGAPGAVPAYMSGTEILTASGWQEPEDAGLLLDGVAPTLAQPKKFVTLAYSPTRDIDTSLGNVYLNELTGNTTYAFTDEVEGTSFKLFVVQDATGGRGVTWPTVIWANGFPGQIDAAPNSTTVVEFHYDGTDWYGEVGPILTSSEDDDVYDLALIQNDYNVDLFRRLGSPLVAGTYTVLVGPGAVISSRINGRPALDMGGAFPSGTSIHIVNRGFIVGLGGDGDSGCGALDDNGSETFSWGVRSSYKNGSDAIAGPAAGVTVTINNASGRIWGGGGGGGSGGAASDGSNTASAGGPGGGGAGGGKGGQPFLVCGYENGSTVTVGTAGGPGLINLDDSASGGTAGAKAEDGAPAGAGGAGGDFGEAGEAGTAASGGDANNKVPPTSGGTAGRAVTAGYAGSLSIISGTGSPNVKGAV